MTNDPDWVVIISMAIAVVGSIGLAILKGRQLRWRDPNRFFSWADKKLLRIQAGDQCEHKPPLWRRCPGPAQEADHVIPWSRGGITHLTNGQYLCRKHNQRKSASLPTTIYRWRLKRRRLRYRTRAQSSTRKQARR